MITISVAFYLLLSTTSILLLAQINVSIASTTQVDDSLSFNTRSEEISSTSQVNVFNIYSSQTAEITICSPISNGSICFFVSDEISLRTYNSTLFFKSTIQINNLSMTSSFVLKSEGSTESQDLSLTRLSPRTYSSPLLFDIISLAGYSSSFTLSETISSASTLNEISGTSQINVFTASATQTLEISRCFLLLSTFCTPNFSTPLYTSSSFLLSERNYKSKASTPRVNSLTVFSKSTTHVDDSSFFNILDNKISSTFQTTTINYYYSTDFSSQKFEINEESEIWISSFFYSKIYISPSTTSSSLPPNESCFKTQASSARVYSSIVFSEPTTQVRHSSSFSILNKQISSNSQIYVFNVSSSQKVEIIKSSEDSVSSFFYSQMYSTPLISSSSFAPNKSYYKTQTLSLRVYSTIKFSESSSIKDFIVDINKIKVDKKSPRLASWIIVLIVASVFLFTLVIVILLQKNLKKVQNRVHLFRFSRRIYPNVSNVKDAEAPQSASLTVNSSTNTKYNVDSCKLNDILNTKYKCRTEADEKSDL
ncbi:uncharacterized protein LOC136089403 [Hydra vulgaris]|uniref:Uncharacterized protein LOC136089403 n=1 Tax=Hydra vulgaris TaxID=6087 RepID=A0ABM4DAP8_HYDVU